MSIVEPPEPSAVARSMVGPPVAARVSLQDEAHVEKLTLIGHVTGGVRIEGRREVTWPHRVGVVPPVADCYQPRDVAAVLRGELTAGRTAAATQVLAGLGGIGKTQLAAAYAEDSWATGELDLLVWVTAASREALLAGYALAAWDVAGAPEGELPEQRAARLLAWLAGTDRRWLVVLDDVTDPQHLSGLWPGGPGGRALVTTRRHDAVLAGGGRRLVEVDPFTSAEAVNYLSARLTEGQLDDAGGVAEDLGRLPLALAQASSYMRDRGLTCAAYRRRFAERRVERALPADAPADDYPGIVATTWALSIAAADQCPPERLATPTLNLAALLNPNGVPAALFTTAAARGYLGAGERTPDAGTRRRRWRRWPQAAPTTAESSVSTVEDAADALQTLRRFSLAALSGEAEAAAGTLQVHALVQRVVRESLDVDEIQRAARAAAGGLLQTWPDADYEPRNALLAESLRASTTLLEAHCSAAVWSPDAHPVLFRAGRSLRDAGLTAEAVAHWRRLAGTAADLLGADHPNTLASRGNLALAYRDAGRLEEALALFERTLADFERRLGADHPDTLTS